MQTGERVGDYQLGEVVRTGNRSIVYRAQYSPLGAAGDDEQLSGSLVKTPSGEIHRRVLLKTVKPGIAITPEVREALRREAEQLCVLQYPFLFCPLRLIDRADAAALIYADRGGSRLDEGVGNFVYGTRQVGSRGESLPEVNGKL